MFVLVGRSGEVVVASAFFSTSDVLLRSAEEVLPHVLDSTSDPPPLFDGTTRYLFYFTFTPIRVLQNFAITQHDFESGNEIFFHVFPFQ